MSDEELQTRVFNCTAEIKTIDDSLFNSREYQSKKEDLKQFVSPYRERKRDVKDVRLCALDILERRGKV